MKKTSVQKLLKVGQFLFQKQETLKTIFEKDQPYYDKELQMILQVILLDLGLMTTEERALLTTLFWEYLEDQTSFTTFISKAEEIRFSQEVKVVNGSSLPQGNITDSINSMFDLKYELQLKRRKMEHLHTGECELFRAEKEIISIILQELDKKRYF